MREIQSGTNEYIKMLKSLKQKKNRDELGLYMVEGEKTILEAIRYDQPIECVVVCDQENHTASVAEQAGIDVILLPYKFFVQIADTKTPQKELACIKKQNSEPNIDGKFIVALDEVSDPKNLGTIIRTADAMGADCVMLSESSADFFGPKVQRAAMGSSFHLPVYVCNIAPALESFKASGGSVVCGSLEGGGELGRFEKVCVVIGNESRGASQEMLDIADIKFKIEMYGKAESLNAGVAAGIMLYEMRKRLLNS